MNCTAEEEMEREDKLEYSTISNNNLEKNSKETPKE
jgi:hypothetical protein